MWNVMDTWVILENHTLLTVTYPTECLFFTLYRETTVKLQWLAMDELSNIDGQVTKLCNDIKKQKL